jgi:cell division protein FtsI/penicillin-binding protein 2
MKDIAQGRVKFLSGLIVFVSLILLTRLYMLQVVERAYFADKADRQYVSRTDGPFNRGNIYLTDKENNLVSAATLKAGFLLAINPKILEDAENIYDKLNKIYPIPRDMFMSKASKKLDPYEEIARRLPRKLVSKFLFKIVGVLIERRDGDIQVKTSGHSWFRWL